MGCPLFLSLSMKKIFILLVALMAGSMALWADTVTCERARLVAERFRSMKAPGGAALTDITPKEYTTLKVYGGVDGRGFVVVALDDIARPVLGYSLTAPVDAGRMPEPMKLWLDEYQNEIGYYRELGRSPSPETSLLWKRYESREPVRLPAEAHGMVNPMISAMWDQGYPYNLYCPGGSVTGCVATAGAMIMHHWQWPVTGTGFHAYNAADYGRQAVDFSQTTFDWAHMSDNYGYGNTQAENEAVAELMYSIGVAVNMNYSPSGSGAFAIGTVGDNCMQNAYKDYFRYKYTVRSWVYNYYVYSPEEWVDMIKGELDAGRPVQYNGCDLQGCHSFVVDGYDEDDYLSINWGWGGMYNGFFAFGLFTPTGSGWGGNETNNYSSSNSAIVGIEPENVGVDDARRADYDLYTDGMDIVVTNSGLAVEVAIYDMTGFCLYRSSQSEPEARYRVSRHGVYVVTVNHDARKVTL